MKLSDEMLIELSYVQISTYRERVMKALDGDLKMPTPIAKETNINVKHISKVLSELREHGLIECINPEASKGRLYRLTDKGNELVKYLPDE